jgi:hypothetical protein
VEQGVLPSVEAPANGPATPNERESASRKDWKAELKELKSMLDDKILTKAEFDAETRVDRESILAELVRHPLRLPKTNGLYNYPHLSSPMTTFYPMFYEYFSDAGSRFGS